MSGASCQNDADVFDYIIVGAGSAGCVLANRLSADPHMRVGLIEAGSSHHQYWIDVPAGTRKVVGHPSTDWCYESEPEPVLGRKGPVSRGKVLGGSSSINGTVYVRGLPYDYDRWRELGLVGWGWEDVEPNFRRMEHYTDGGDEIRGGDGELHVEQPRIRMSIFDVLDRAAIQAGLQKRDSFNRGQNEGFGMFDVTQCRGRRWSSAKAFLDPVRGRRNLAVITDALCVALTFEGARATGVRVRVEGAECRFEARREIVLAAGSIGTPQLLQLSGIGPREVLRRAGVPIRYEQSAVGANLQDHLSMRLAYRVHGIETVNTRYHNLIKRAMMGLEHAVRGSGPLVMGAPLWGGFLRSEEDRAVANLQFLAMPVTFTGTTSFAEPDRFDGVSCGIYNMHPQSRGRVWITSPHADEPPAILHNYLTHEEDRRVAVESVKLMRRLFAQPAFRALSPIELRPGEAAQTDEELLAAGIASCGTAYHQVGTCAMGKGAHAPVDERLRLRGVAGLRIADGSVLPTLISGNTNACIMMIGDKAADMIRADARH